MFRKSAAVLLSAVMMLGTACATASAANVNFAAAAASEERKTTEGIIEDAAAELVGTGDGVTVSDALVNEIIEKTGNNPTEETVDRTMSEYAVLDTSELPENARKIAENAEYKILADNVVYIVVNIEENPELLDLITLCHTSAALLEKQNAFAANSERTDLLLNDYSHIAGELALHSMVYTLTKAAGGADKNSALNSYYESARTAELNRNETRGAGLIQVIGQLLEFFYKLITGTFGR